MNTLALKTGREKNDLQFPCFVNGSSSLWMLPTETQVTGYISENAGCKSKQIATYFTCTTKEINRARLDYCGIYKIRGIVTDRNFCHYIAPSDVSEQETSDLIVADVTNTPTEIVNREASPCSLESSLPRGLLVASGMRECIVQAQPQEHSKGVGSHHILHIWYICMSFAMIIVLICNRDMYIDWIVASCSDFTTRTMLIVHGLVALWNNGLAPLWSGTMVLCI